MLKRLYKISFLQEAGFHAVYNVNIVTLQVRILKNTTLQIYIYKGLISVNARRPIQKRKMTEHFFLSFSNPGNLQGR